MIVFGHTDDKSKCIKEELIKLNIKSDSVKAKHPILNPFYLLKLLIKGQKVKVYVFRYLNDSNSLFLAYLRVLSEAFIILIAKLFKIELWWLCHNIDRETSTHYPKLTRIRRSNVVKYSKYIFTTNELLIPKAKELFKNKKIDSLSLGYIDNGFSHIKSNDKVEQELLCWMDEKRASNNSKFIFCIGSPAKKSIHFKLISSFVDLLNKQSVQETWYAIVIGDAVSDSQYIFNIPFKMSLSSSFIKKYSSFYYRIIDDYSMSYSIFEAAKYKIPIITENYGLIPQIIERYNIGVVINDRKNIYSKVNSFSLAKANFDGFLNDNNWKVAAKKIKCYYEKV